MAITTPVREEQEVSSKPKDPVGQSVVRADAEEKVRGEPCYYGDLSLPNMLHGRVLHSRYPHARILSIDTSKAKALPGVAVVATAADVPGLNSFGTGLSLASDKQVLSDKKVRFTGDSVALVAAESVEIAARAVELIEVQYEELPAVFDPKEAMLPTAPRVHEDRKDNVVQHFKLRKGSVDDAFKKCDVIVENSYRTPYVEHAYLEVEGALATRHPDGGVTVWVGSQFAYNTRNNVARVLGITPDKVRVINANAGGGFGGKEDPGGFECAAHAALLAWLSGRPVKLVYDRDESIIASAKRHPALIEYKTGATKDGRLQAVEIRVYLNKGAYASVGALKPPGGGLTSKAGYHAPGPYVIPNVRVDVYNVYTNMPFGGAMRGFGIPQMNFAYEQQIDEVAQRLGIDPVEFRLINGLEAGTRTASNQLLEHSVGLKETLRKAAEKAGWKQFRQQKAKTRATGRFRRGMGISSFNFATCLGAWPEYANATMEVDAHGRVLVRAGIAEIGQGSRTALAQIAAQALEIPLELVVATKGDTATDQDSLLTVASRGTVMAGNAIIRAAKDARQTLLEMAADLMEVPVKQVVQVNHEFRHVESNKAVPAKEVLLYTFRCGRRLIGKGWWCVPKIKIDPETGQGNPFHIYAYGTSIIEVEVDTETGTVEVKRVVHAQDVGKAINPKLVEAQMEGGVSMGLGYALTEEIVVEQGRILNPNFATYLIPTVSDTPAIETITVEDPYPNGPFGAKGVGEPGALPTAAAIANAVYDAVGVRIRQLPVTAERVWKALQENAESVAAD
jgi:CO/xanthine dehydrogenase Mo-binding subunit